MTSARAEGWDSLDPGALEDLTGKDFEDFCSDLISYEAYDRHPEPDIGGPVNEGKDGGRDVLLSLTQAPRISRADYQLRYHLKPLTHDGVGRTAYSCKSGKSWLDQALKDAKKRGERAIEILLEGGRFTLLINKVAKLDEKYRCDGVDLKPHEHLVAALWERMKGRNPAAPDPATRVEILDAYTLAGYLRGRRPEDGAVMKWVERFNLRSVLHGLDAWQLLHSEQREDLPFVDEESRAGIILDIVRFAQTRAVSAKERVSWLLGPPGIGKTRLIIEALGRDDNVSHRVRVAFTGDEGRDALQDLLHRYSSLFLVVDDCPAELAREIARRFRAETRERPDCHLLIITPAAYSERDATDISIRWELQRLDDVASLKVARNAVSSNATLAPGELEQIVRLAEGYPWFLALLAQEAEREGRAPRSMREAVEWALASGGDVRGQALTDLRRNRMRALLAILMTRGVDWAALTTPQRDSVARAVGLSRWDEVSQIADDCLRRGILRRRYHFQYVTPQVLAREILSLLFDPSGGDDPGGRRFQEHGREFLEGFYEELRRLGIHANIERLMAEAVLEGIKDRGNDWSALLGSFLLGAPLRFAATAMPGAIAHALSEAIEGTPLDELRARVDVRRPLMFALTELVSRRDGFEDAERSLFKLALAENEAFGNNATATWAGLFSPVLHMTHRSPALREQLLKARLSSVSSAERLLALKGLRSMMATNESRIAPSAVDGQWPRPTNDEAHAIRIAAWTLLLQRVVDDNEEIVEASVEILCRKLLLAVWAGLGEVVLPLVTSRVPELREQHRRRIFEVVSQVKALGAENPINSNPVLHDLVRALAPANFSEQLRQQVETWIADIEETPSKQVDDLALESLADLSLLRPELDWLFSTDAVRGTRFAAALGRHDGGAVLLAELKERALSPDSPAGARAFLTWYLVGLQEAGRSDLVDDELGALRAHPYGALLVAQTTVLTAATEKRLRWVEESIRDGSAGRELVSTAGFHGRWLKRVSDDRVRTFLGVLLGEGSAEAAVAVLRIVRDRIAEDPSRIANFEDPVKVALERALSDDAPRHGRSAWAACALAIVDLGRVDAVADLAAWALGRSSGALHDAWRVLHRAQAKDPNATWDAIAGRVDRREKEGGRLVLAFRFHRDRFDWPTERVLNWVGDDARRGRAAVQLVQPDADTLPPIYRGLIERFGAESSVANEVMARIESTDGLVASLADHARAQLLAAKRWALDENPAVRNFAERLAVSLQEDLVHAG